jgi:folate-binding protein YgfZ
MSSWQQFLVSRGAIAAGTGTDHFGDPRAELAAARDATIVADLSHNALLAVTGDDATRFLHGQFTNDVENLPPGAAQWNGWCSAKGRLLATFLLWRRGDDDYLLMLPAEIAPTVARKLSMYVLRSKVKITDVSAGLVRIGFAGKSASLIVARELGHAPDAMRTVEKDGAACIALDAERFVLLTPESSAPALWERLALHARAAGRDAWEWKGIQAGIPTIFAATQDAFVPQMANFELVGGVSFKKGCYPGQEIVARTQYRGILKKRMAVAHVDGEARPSAGDDVYGQTYGDQSAGSIVAAAPAPDGGFDALVVAQIEDLKGGALRWKSPQGAPLIVRSSPVDKPAA